MKKKVLGIFAVLAVAVLGVGMVAAQGMGGLMRNGLSEEDMEAHRDAVQDAIETDDYAEWEGLMQDRISWMEDMISEENFEMLKEQHQNREEFRAAVQELKDSGDWSFEDMEALREQYGIENMGQGKGRGQGKMVQRIGQGLGDCMLE